MLLNQMDLILTIVAVSLGLAELNPLMRGLVAAPGLLLFVKSVVPIVIAWLAPGRLLLPAILLLICIIAWDIKELLIHLL